MKLQHKSRICSVMLWFKVQTNSLGCGILAVHSNLFNHYLFGVGKLPEKAQLLVFFISQLISH